jgi:hypothetical protein
MRHSHHHHHCYNLLLGYLQGKQMTTYWLLGETLTDSMDSYSDPSLLCDLPHETIDPCFRPLVSP